VRVWVVPINHDFLAARSPRVARRVRISARMTAMNSLSNLKVAAKQRLLEGRPSWTWVWARPRMRHGLLSSPGGADHAGVCAVSCVARSMTRIRGFLGARVAVGFG